MKGDYRWESGPLYDDVNEYDAWEIFIGDFEDEPRYNAIVGEYYYRSIIGVESELKIDIKPWDFAYE